ncbi:DNA repair protein RadC [Desulfofarcimen acetoxidans DSM 771]|uniref:DNA repair protein RadC n=1 Tax=Desulfofarcimen acetoxidans (strain ATCC 49208 / DSM 771 / KCTC 5769 / VKM B-1644 / 5575) TaxID=485916 RepID=C8VVH2_DESAS|nr:DNA repair protein RadC [Desulfofarcimen acetoxidans]ACV62287.1 DNA repair protein RadC [Desulfofarcimen acetoxidans DSM 771]
MKTNLFGDAVPVNKCFGLNKIRERGLNYGTSVLNDAELVMTLLGINLEKAMNLINIINGIRGLMDVSVEQLAEVKGVGNSKALALKAAVEIGQRIAKTKAMECPSVKTPDDAVNYVMEEMRYMDREHFKALLLNTKNRVISLEAISVGTLNSSNVHPRELFKVAIKRSAAAIILIHNHPSGDPTPSREDIDVTERLGEAGKIVGIDVLDHIVIGDGKFVSLKAKGLF